MMSKIDKRADSEVGIAEAVAAARRAAREAEGIARAAELAVQEAEEATTVSSSGMERRRRTRDAFDRLRLGGTALVVVFGIIGAAVLGSTGLALAVHHHSVVAAEQRDFELLQGARQAVINLISPSADDAAGSAQRVIDTATGDWLNEFGTMRADFTAAITESSTKSTGEILGAGIEGTNDDGTTTVLVAAVSKVTNSAGAVDEPRTWRLRVRVTEDAGMYKLSKVEVVP
ncbi:hypothetical protein ACFVKB_17030 [Rhodococcus sp. NPDC127530]|uniref:hypothetical protein n=1 Tax=unclassified Rhodococcus (in: high G+C Gram-positive bacteria) TaxID=192944 RepID=UPI003637D968